MKNIAKELFMSGYSCSEAILTAGIQKGYAPVEIALCATAFSGGMGSGCLCGAVAGAQILLSSKFGRSNPSSNSADCKSMAKELVEKFKAKHKFTCCKALTAGLEMGTPERKANCVNMVETAAEIVEEMLLKEKIHS